MPSSLLSKEIYEKIANFRYQLRKFLHFSEVASRKVGITPQQHQLLLTLIGFPGRDYATATEIAEKLQIAHHSCVGLINRCKELGLVHKMPNPNDGRSQYIGLTDEGENVIQKLTMIHLEELQKIEVDIFF